MNLAFAGASDSVIAVSAAFGMWNGKLNHVNLPLKSLPVHDWVFATAELHHVIMQWPETKAIRTMAAT